MTQYLRSIACLQYFFIYASEANNEKSQSQVVDRWLNLIKASSSTTSTTTTIITLTVMPYAREFKAEGKRVWAMYTKPQKSSGIE